MLKEINVFFCSSTLKTQLPCILPFKSSTVSFRSSAANSLAMLAVHPFPGVKEEGTKLPLCKFPGRQRELRHRCNTSRDCAQPLKHWPLYCDRLPKFKVHLKITSFKNPPKNCSCLSGALAFQSPANFKDFCKLFEAISTVCKTSNSVKTVIHSLFLLSLRSTKGILIAFE